jgi:hypothetical protein
MGAKNKVISGEYNNYSVVSGFGNIVICIPGTDKKIIIDKSIVDNYELVTDEHRKSASSGIARGIIGGALLGPVGLLVGGLSAKSKGIYIVAIQFKDGAKSLLEIDDKTYKALVKKLF